MLFIFGQFHAGLSPNWGVTILQIILLWSEWNTGGENDGNEQEYGDKWNTVLANPNANSSKHFGQTE
jgi:hypothetical protein